MFEMLLPLPTPASYRASLRAAFRRVAGGVSRGEINHGISRTGLANARPNSDWRKRKRRASVSVCGTRKTMLVCGLSKRFQRVGVEEEIDNIQALDAIVVKRGIVVEREQELWMVVADGFALQYSCLENPMDGGAW